MDWETTVAPTRSLVTMQQALDQLEAPSETAAPNLDVRIKAADARLDGPDSETGRCFLRRTIRASWRTWQTERPVPGGSPITVLSARWEEAVGVWHPIEAAARALWGGAIVELGETPQFYEVGDVVEVVYQAGNDDVPADVQVLALALIADFDERQAATLGVGEGAGVPNPAMEAIKARYDARRLLSPAWAA